MNRNCCWASCPCFPCPFRSCRSTLVAPPCRSCLAGSQWPPELASELGDAGACLRGLVHRPILFAP
eukprot:1267852-Pyramimonas_sp.AAC.1